MKKSIFLMLIQCCIIYFGHAQNNNMEEPIDDSNEISTTRLFSVGNEFVPRTMSPDVSAFLKVNYIPLNNYTGRANVSIPIFTINDGGISVPISLSYNTSGVKVNDISSCVGLNWSLNAGGVVSKMVKGLEDCSFKYSAHQIISLGWLFRKNPGNKFNFSFAPPSFFEGGWEYNNDREPDLFVGQAPGLSVEFIHDLDLKPIELNGNRNKINTTFGSTDIVTFFDFPTGFNVNQQPNYTYPGGGSRILEKVITSVEVVNTSGLKYNFSDVEISQNVDIHNGPDREYPDAEKRITNEKIDCYKLSSIHDSLNSRTVTFEYKKYGLEKTDTIKMCDNYVYDGNVLLLRYERKITKHPQKCRLAKIKFTSGSVNFIYNEGRMDVDGEKALTDIVVKDNNENIIKHFKLVYGYFFSKTGAVYPQDCRLRLDALYEVDANEMNELPGYHFYYNKTILPERGSYKCDFLGYYNNESYLGLNRPSPILYYYLNQGEDSFLPFPLDDYQQYEIQGGISLQANEEYAKAGILKKIKYPTGGYQEFDYESNSFLIKGKEVKGGGLRIKKQRIFNPEKQNLRTLLYSYTDEEGKTSGRMGSVPRFTDAEFYLTYPDNFERIENKTQIAENVIFFPTDYPRTQLELTQGAYVGYKRVLVEDSVSNGYTEYIYTSFSEYPNEKAVLSDELGSFLHPKYNFKKENGLIPTIINDKDIFRGKLLSKKVFDLNAKLIKEEIWEYKSKKLEELDLSYLFNTTAFMRQRSGQPMNFTKDYKNSILIKGERFLNSHYKSTLKTDNGSLIDSIEYTYDSVYPFPREITKNNSEGNILSKKFYYPQDANNIDTYLAGQKGIFNELVNKEYCNFSSPIKTEKYTNDQLLEVVQNEFADDMNKIRIRYRKKGLRNNNLDLFETFDLFDTKGNLRQYKSSNGIYISFIWGYNESLPIAKIENTTYDQVMGAIGFLYEELQDKTEEELRNIFKNLRNHPAMSDAMITSYTYKPLVGITSETSPNGKTILYNYDGFGRLKTLTDHNGKVLKKHKYHYAE